MSEQQAGEPAGASRGPGRVAGATFVWPAPRTSMRQPVLRGSREHRQVWGFAREWTTTDQAHVCALEWLNDVSKAVKDAPLARAWSRDDLAASAGLSYNAVKDLESGLRGRQRRRCSWCCTRCSSS